VPRDDGLGTPGDGTFNTPPLVEAADSGPFFHNDSVQTIEAAVAFYDGESFNNSPAGQALARIDPEGEGIELDATEITAIAAFLRVINALENSRQAEQLLDESTRSPPPRGEAAKDLLRSARHETEDAIHVLSGGGLHPRAVQQFQEALKQIDKAASYYLPDKSAVDAAIRAHVMARADIVEPR
jgi:hypothetical protein